MMKGKLIEILNCSSYFCNKELSDSFIVPYLAKNANYEIVLCGEKRSNYQKILWLSNYSIKPVFIIDESHNDKTDYFGVTTIDIVSLIVYKKNKNIIILIDNVQMNHFLKKVLAKLMFFKFKIILFQRNYFWYADWRYFIQSNKTAFIDFFDKLADNISKQIYIEYLRCIIQDDFYRGKNDMSSKKYIDESVFKWNDNESVLNCGAAIGDTIYHIIYNKKYFDRIYAFEASKTMYDLCKKNINLLPKEYRTKIELYNMYLTSDTDINKVLKNRPLTIIGLDSEGSELEVLHCLKDDIKNSNPILALSAYHKADDFLVIPNFIENLGLNYRYYLRKYVASNPHYNKDELTLYAVPVERC